MQRAIILLLLPLFCLQNSTFCMDTMQKKQKTWREAIIDPYKDDSQKTKDELKAERVLMARCFWQLPPEVGARISKFLLYPLIMNASPSCIHAFPIVCPFRQKDKWPGVLGRINITWNDTGLLLNGIDFGTCTRATWCWNAKKLQWEKDEKSITPFSVDDQHWYKELAKNRKSFFTWTLPRLNKQTKRYYETQKKLNLDEMIIFVMTETGKLGSKWRQDEVIKPVLTCIEQKGLKINNFFVQ